MRRGVAASSVALVAALLVSGCAAGAPQPATTPAPTSTNGNSDATPEDSTGGVTDSVPTDFPIDDVPLIDGTIAFATTLDTGWSIWIASEDTAAGFTAAKALLDSAGYSNEGESTTRQGSFVSYHGTTYDVQVTAGEDPDYGSVVAYTVYRNG